MKKKKKNKQRPHFCKQQSQLLQFSSFFWLFFFLYSLWDLLYFLLINQMPKTKIVNKGESMKKISVALILASIFGKQERERKGSRSDRTKGRKEGSSNL
jgi:hypothetical protein